MRQKIRVLIADDEALGRREMRRLLKAHSEVVIVAEAEDGDQAVSLIEKHEPDLVFLDIRMPGKDGFEVLDALEPPLPEIVFSTAYDQFGVDAVRRGALDYLLKPVAPEDLARAIQRAADRVQGGGRTLGQKNRLRSGDKIFVHEGKTSLFFEVGSIQILESEEFFRANRKQIVNLKTILGCQPIQGGRYVASLEQGDQIEISRRQARIFREKLRI